MIKIWAKVMDKNKIVKQTTFFDNAEKMDYSLFFEYLTKICHTLDIPTPIILKTHIFNYAKFNFVRFTKDDFVRLIQVINKNNQIYNYSGQRARNNSIIASAKFVTSKNTTSVYIAVVTENGKCDSEAEVYIDNVAVMLPGEAPKYVAGKTYSSKFNNVANARADGWKGYF